jgi:hypothetical protein
MRSFLIIIVLFTAACQSGSNDNTKQSPTTNTLVGADKDAKGCIGSAGYIWSAVKDSCIRPFEVGTPFVRYEAATGVIDSLKVAYVVLSEDKQRAEVFFGATDKPVVMDALPVQEGETLPVLFENTTEMVKLRSHRDMFQLLYLDSVQYIQYYDAEKGMGKWLKKVGGNFKGQTVNKQKDKK